MEKKAIWIQEECLCVVTHRRDNDIEMLQDARGTNEIEIDV